MADGKRGEDVPAWRVYERVLACFEVETAGMDVSVTPNASLVGSVSGTPRQIDVLVDARWETGTQRRIVFDAKRRGRKLTVQDVDAFVGFMSDVRAGRGVLVCTNVGLRTAGLQKGLARLARGMAGDGNSRRHKDGG